MSASDGVDRKSNAGSRASTAHTDNQTSPQTQNANLVSITHLGFHRNTPLSREIDLYQRHRIKKLKQQNARGY